MKNYSFVRLHDNSLNRSFENVDIYQLVTYAIFLICVMQFSHNNIVSPFFLTTEVLRHFLKRCFVWSFIISFFLILTDRIDEITEIKSDEVFFIDMVYLHGSFVSLKGLSNHRSSTCSCHNFLTSLICLN